MPPKRNKNIESAFYFYMIEKRQETERRLSRKIAMKDLPGILYGEWKELSEAKKLKYKSMCSDAKNSAEKYDSRGIPLSLLQKNEEEEMDRKIRMKEEIKENIASMRMSGDLFTKDIYVVAGSYFISMEDGSYKPAAISVCRFNVKDGLKDHYHNIFPIEIPTGFRREAKEHSENTHNLMECTIGKAINFVSEFSKFITQSGKKDPPTLYVREELYEPVKWMLDNFAFPWRFKIYSLDVLYQYVYSAIESQVSNIDSIPVSIAKDMLNFTEYDYMPEMCCQWHQEFAPDNARFCTLNIVQRWVFNMFHYLPIDNEKLGIEKKVNKHFPQRSMDEITYEMKNAMKKEDERKLKSSRKMLKNWKPVDDEETVETPDDNPDQWPTLGGPAKGKSGSMQGVAGAEISKAGWGRGRGGKPFQ